MSKRTNPADILIGKRLREARVKSGKTQGQVAKMLGVTFQQIAKYEQGENAIKAAQLPVLAEGLKYTVMFFLKDL